MKSLSQVVLFSGILMMGGTGCGCWRGAPAEALIAKGGQAVPVITVAADASLPERHAAEELAALLKQVTGAEFAIKLSTEAGQNPQIAVGPGAAKALAPNLSLDGLGADGIVIQAVLPNLILTGGVGAPRGTLYAVYTFLEDQVGCRWWSRGESTIPSKPTLAVPGDLAVRFVPVLERRDQCFVEGFDPDWSVRNKYNGWCGPGDDEARGGILGFAGPGCHTFFQMIPPKEYFEKHPEWFSEIDGKRTAEASQLCLTNPEVLVFVIAKCKEWLRANPKAVFVSVTQNDWNGWCTCATCKAVDEAEGGQSGTMIRFANAVAEALEPEFPYAAVDTFAYQYTRKPPKLVKPRQNVIVRLCSIECDFAHPLEHPNNQAFRADIEGWAKICNRLYIWDYVTNFQNYIQPHPNLRVIGPNIRFFVKNHVKGLFEQGDYQSPGGEFGALRAWVMGKLLWNPGLDDQALIREFLAGYYGPAAPYLKNYIDLIHDPVLIKDFHMGCYAPPTSPYLNAATLLQAERLLGQAEAAVAGNPTLLKRTRVAHLPVRHVAILRWPRLKFMATQAGSEWTFPATRLAAITEFEEVCAQNQITLLNEAATPIASLRQNYGDQRREAATAPPDLANLANGAWTDLQDDLFSYYLKGKFCDCRPDEKASDGMAAWMPGDHREWAVSLRLDDPEFDLQGKYALYAVVRVEKQADAETAFTAGVWNWETKQGVCSISVPGAQVKDGEYHAYQVGEFVPAKGMGFWVAPPANPAAIPAIWIDRLIFVPVIN